jgi:hypothetical protein
MSATSEEELGGIGVHVELVIGGNDLEAIVNDVLMEDGGASFLVGIVEPTEPGVDAWHWAARCWGLGLFVVLVF